MPSKDKTIQATATHQAARIFGLGEIPIESGEFLDLSDGCLRLPKSTIDRMVATGMLLSMDPRSVALREIDHEAAILRDEAQAELVAEEKKINAAYLEAMQPLNEKYPNQPAPYHEAKGNLEAQAQHALNKLHQDHEQKLATITAEALAKKQKCV